MNCNVCGVNEAAIHLTEIVNNQMVEVHLCEACAQEKGTDFKTHFNLGDLLMGLSSLDQPARSSDKQHTQVCASCDMSYEEFGKSGRLGCSDCYNAFSKMLLPLIQRVQRATHHLGKKPSKISRSVRTTYDLRLLQDRLRKSVDMEEYEKAAKLRDEIKRMEDKLKKVKKK